MILLYGLSATPLLWANWANISHGLMEQNIQCVLADVKDPKIIFAASDKRVYRTADGGISWGLVLTLRSGAERARSIYLDTADHHVVYVCTDRGIYRSKDLGNSWNLFYIIPADGTQKVLCMANDSAKPELLWIGTDHGLVQMDQKNHESHKVNGIPDISIYSILLNQPAAPEKIVTTSKGVYRNMREGGAWEMVFAKKAEEAEPVDGTGSQQFGVEEITTAPLFSNLIFFPDQNKFYAAARHGVLQGAESASSWKLLEGQTLPDKKINYIVRSKKTFYIATDRGVFQWDDRSHQFRENYLGLESNEVWSLDYSVAGDYLLAATKKGVYRLLNPELNLSLPANKEIPMNEPREIFNRFSIDPTIHEVQEAAIRYAEVQPQKIEEWRRAAARKAWAPTLSFHQNFQTSDNIDIDRGGTADPDKFIRGPLEKSQDQYFTVSWNLGDLIWNSDQTSIDSRAKLMVELRNDILNEVTHLYFERRRLQVEMMTSPAQESKAQIENQIRLEELTSGIDALTGGYLTNRLVERVE